MSLCQEEHATFVNHDPSFKFQDGSVCDILLLKDGLSKQGLNKLVNNLDIPIKNSLTDVYTAVKKYSNVSSNEGWRQQGRYRYQRRLQQHVHGYQGHSISNSSQLQGNKTNRWNQSGRRGFYVQSDGFGHQQHQEICCD